MEKLISGIHHITALAGDAQKNLDFYAGVLGLRLVKKTVNFDAPDVYHFYFGNETGEPGTIMTFFPYDGLQRGRHGKGMLNTTSFSLPQSALEYWEKRLKKFDVKFKTPQERFNSEVVIYFEDNAGLGLELIFSENDKRAEYSNGFIPSEFSIRGFFGGEIWVEGYERTAALLTEQMDHTLIAESGNRFRFAATDTPGNYIDIICSPESLRGLGGAGTAHHIAFATSDDETQKKVREKILLRMLNPTPVIDRQYFKSVYFREPGGVLFEIATSGPGFSVDEELKHLGEELKLPTQYESFRKQIEEGLVDVAFEKEKFR